MTAGTAYITLQWNGWLNFIPGSFLIKPSYWMDNMEQSTPFKAAQPSRQNYN